MDISNFVTKNVTEMERMFLECPLLTTILYGDNFVYPSGADVTNMFTNCPANKPTHESWNGVTF